MNRRNFIRLLACTPLAYVLPLKAYSEKPPIDDFSKYSIITSNDGRLISISNGKETETWELTTPYNMSTMVRL